MIVIAEKVACAVYGTFTGMSHSGQILSPSFMFGLIPIVFMSFLQTHNVYGRMRPTVDMVRDIFTSIASGCFVLIVMMYFLGGRFSLPWSYMLLLGESTISGDIYPAIRRLQIAETKNAAILGDKSNKTKHKLRIYEND